METTAISPSASLLARSVSMGMSIRGLVGRGGRTADAPILVVRI